MSGTFHKAEEVPDSGKPQGQRDSDSQAIPANAYEMIKCPTTLLTSGDKKRKIGDGKENPEEQIDREVEAIDGGIMIEGVEGKTGKRRKLEGGKESPDEDVKIKGEDGKIASEKELMPELEKSDANPDDSSDSGAPGLEDGDANLENCDSDDFSSEGSFIDSDNDDEDLPTIHEMNHNDKWKLVQKNGHLTIYKNQIAVYQKSGSCVNVADEGKFICHRLLLERPTGLRGEVRHEIWHHTYISRSMATYTADFEKSRLLWEKSAEHAALKPFLESMSVGKIQVTNIVCLALGSLQTWHHKSWKCRKSSRVQLAVLLTIICLFKSLNGGKDVTCIAQDPDFTVMDRKFLKQHGIDVVHDPQGLGAINENTLVFMVGGYHFLDYVISRGPRPAAFIQSKSERYSLPSIALHKKEAKMDGEMDVLQRFTAYEDDSIDDMMKGCESQAFPNSGGYISGTSMCSSHVYWRRA